MNPSKTVRPAIASTMNGPRRSEQLGGRLDPTNNAKPAKPQASYPADTAGETDLDFFHARPSVNFRNRVAFDGEPPCLLDDGESEIAFIRVFLKRDADGKPATIFREIIYGDWGHG